MALSGGTGAAEFGARPKKEKKAARLPTRRSINFVTAVDRTQLMIKRGAAALVGVIVLAVLGKVLFYDRVQDLREARRQTENVRRQIEEANAYLQDYAETEELFAHYTFTGMTDEELGRVDRVAAMELLERVVMPSNEINSWQLSNNQISLTITGSTLQDISDMAQRLMAEELVSYCVINNATANAGTEDAGESVTASIVIYLTAAEEGSAP